MYKLLPLPYNCIQFLINNAINDNLIKGIHRFDVHNAHYCWNLYQTESNSESFEIN